MASFTDLDTLRQMGLVSLIYNGNHQLCLKFSCAGTGITFTGSMDSVAVIAATKQQMTVDNIGLQGVVGPMGGMMTEYVPLPTVSTTWLVITPGSGNVNIPTNGEHVGYWWDDDSQSYISAVWNSNVTYGMIAFYTTPFAYAGRMELEIKEVSGTVGVHNVSSLTVTVCQANIAICSSSSATVITVYDSSNNPYNAFKYTSDGTDYYYVLDGTQTDWTDDLASIGYHILSVAYLGIEDKYVNWKVWVWLYENSSASETVSFDSNKRYIFDSAYTVNGSKVNLTSHTITIGRPNSTYEILGLIDSYSGFTAYKVYYHAIPNS